MRSPTYTKECQTVKGFGEIYERNLQARYSYSISPPHSTQDGRAQEKSIPQPTTVALNPEELPEALF